MLAHVYATEALAIEAVEAIDAALGPTETIRRCDVVNGELVVRDEQVIARKPWAAPMELRSGQWAVVHNPRILAAHEGKSVRVRGRNRVIPGSLGARAIDESELMPGAR